MNIIDRMKQQARACNKYLTDEVMDKWGLDRLVAYTHPTDRNHFKSIIRQETERIIEHLMNKDHKMNEIQAKKHINQCEENIQDFKLLILQTL